MNNIPPFWESKSNRIWGPIMTSQRSWRCRDFELRYMDCLTAYGVNKKSAMKCTDYYDDWYECVNALKAYTRYQRMRLERMKQYHFGDRTKENYVPETLDGSYLAAKSVN